MNREQRRKQEREARKMKGVVSAIPENKVLKRFTEDEFQQFIFDIDYQARVDTINMMMTAFALAEHRIHKHGHARIGKTLNYVNELMDNVINRKATWAQYAEECLNETGWRFINEPEDMKGDTEK